MKKINKYEVIKLFSLHDCELISDYAGCSIKMDFKCVKCGLIGSLSLDKFKRKIKKGLICNCLTWTAEADEILIKYYGKETREFILNKLQGVTYSMLKSRVKILNLTGDTSFVMKKVRSGNYRRYYFDFDYFSKIDINRSYWAGFICAKSCIHGSHIQINSTKIDIEIFKLLQDEVGHTDTIRMVNNNISINFFGADKWLIGLANNYYINETFALEHLDEQNTLYYISGYVLGQKSITEESFELSGSKYLLEWIKKWFDFWCPAMKRKYTEIYEDNDKYHYRILGHRANYLAKKMIIK